jgi:hypothetical protein
VKENKTYIFLNQSKYKSFRYPTTLNGVEELVDSDDQLKVDFGAEMTSFLRRELDKKSLRYRMICIDMLNENRSKMDYYRELRKILSYHGARVAELNVQMSDSKHMAEKMKETKEEVKLEEATAIFNAKQLTYEQGIECEDKNDRELNRKGSSCTIAPPRTLFWRYY